MFGLHEFTGGTLKSVLNPEIVLVFIEIAQERDCLSESDRIMKKIEELVLKLHELKILKKKKSTNFIAGRIMEKDFLKVFKLNNR